jgi:hypothetical protein
MSDSFEVKYAIVTLPGTLADGIPFPLFKVVNKGGAITILEWQLTCATAMVVGTANLIYGTLSATNGTVVPVATIGTNFGTGGGTFPALCLVDGSVDTPTVPAGNWIALRVGTMAAAAQNSVRIAYIQGRAYGA